MKTILFFITFLSFSFFSGRSSIWGDESKTYLLYYRYNKDTKLEESKSRVLEYHLLSISRPESSEHDAVTVFSWNPENGDKTVNEIALRDAKTLLTLVHDTSSKEEIIGKYKEEKNISTESDDVEQRAIGRRIEQIFLDTTLIHYNEKVKVDTLSITNLAINVISLNKILEDENRSAEVDSLDSYLQSIISYSANDIAAPYGEEKAVKLFELTSLILSLKDENNTVYNVVNEGKSILDQIENNKNFIMAIGFIILLVLGLIFLPRKSPFQRKRSFQRRIEDNQVESRVNKRKGKEIIPTERPDSDSVDYGKVDLFGFQRRIEGNQVESRVNKRKGKEIIPTERPDSDSVDYGKVDLFEDDDAKVPTDDRNQSEEDISTPTPLDEIGGEFRLRWDNIESQITSDKEELKKWFEIQFTRWFSSLGSSLFSVDDILYWPDFCTKLVDDGKQDSPNYSKRIWELLPPETQTLIEELAAGNDLSDEDKYKIITIFNDILCQKDFYQEQAFSGTPLPDKLQELLNDPNNRKSTKNIHKFNRLLFEAAFPNEIAKCLFFDEWLESKFADLQRRFEDEIQEKLRNDNTKIDRQCQDLVERCSRYCRYLYIKARQEGERKLPLQENSGQEKQVKFLESLDQLLNRFLREHSDISKGNRVLSSIQIFQKQLQDCLKGISSGIPEPRELELTVKSLEEFEEKRFHESENSEEEEPWFDLERSYLQAVRHECQEHVGQYRRELRIALNGEDLQAQEERIIEKINRLIKMDLCGRLLPELDGTLLEVRSEEEQLLLKAFNDWLKKELFPRLGLEEILVQVGDPFVPGLHEVARTIGKPGGNAVVVKVLCRGVRKRGATGEPIQPPQVWKGEPGNAQ